MGLKDVDFEIDQDILDALEITIPFHNIDEAEYALHLRVIIPKMLIEYDDTRHQVLEFDYRPVGFSGFMDCVTHSLVVTDQGLFEVGRYPAVSLTEQTRYWQWFLHRRLATSDEINEWMNDKEDTTSDLMERVYQALIGSY